jgi:transposase
MRGVDERTGALFSYVDLEARVPPGHPLRPIRKIVNAALTGLSPSLRDLYARIGRPSIPPEQLLRALLLQAFYSIRSERQLMERLDFDLLFRWFVGLGIDDPVWNHSTFSKNRDRLLAGDVAAEFLVQVLDQAQVRRLLSSEHFSVDGSLVGRRSGATTELAPGSQPTGVDEELPAQGRSGRPAGGPERQPRLSRRAAPQRQPFALRADTTSALGASEATTDPDARLYRKGPGQEARLCFIGHVLRENRHGLVVDAELTRASGHAERLAALAMLDRLPTMGPVTLGADRGFDAKDFVFELRERRVTPHIAQNTSGRRSAVDGRTTRHPGYGASQRVRKRIEEAFSWIKTIAGQSRTKLRGLDRVRWSFTLAAAAYNLIRLPRLLAGLA